VISVVCLFVCLSVCPLSAENGGRTPTRIYNSLAYLFNYVITWRHLQNRKYIPKYIAVRGGPDHGHR